MLKFLQSELHVHEGPNIKGVSDSELQKRPVYEGVQNTSKLKKLFSLKIHLIIPVGCHIARDTMDQNA